MYMYLFYIFVVFLDRRTLLGICSFTIYVIIFGKLANYKNINCHTRFMDKKEQSKKIILILKKSYPLAKCSLNYSNPLQLLIATILSAQCTDKRVNKTTPALFKRFKTAKDFASAHIVEIENIVKSCGFYRSKAKSISETCKRLAADYKGIVPNKIEDLLKFRGVARKTANVVLGNVFHDPQGVVVDTHMIRIANRLG